jgi:recyclin-1
MQEKKRFESTLDESVASGLNAGIEVLMNQVSIFAILLLGLVI